MNQAVNDMSFTRHNNLSYMQHNNLSYAQHKKLSYTRYDIGKKGLHIDWSKLAFKYVESEEFQNFNVTTLISHYEMLVYEEAIKITPFNADYGKWNDAITVNANKIMDSGSLMVQEFILVENDYNVFVVLDEPKITDTTMDRALKLLEVAKIPGYTFFGEKVTYTAKQVASHIQFKIKLYPNSEQE
jgi:hypothetical protein